MFERFSDDARAVIRRAAADAKGFGHRYVGTEHLLLALTASAGPAGEILRERGVRPELVTEQIIRQAGLGVGAGLFAGLDEQALASIGIDLDAVRARIEASFSPAALLGAERAIRQQRPAWYRRRVR